MPAGIGRSLAISLKAETNQFNRELKGAHKELAKFKSGIGKMGKVVAASFAGMAVAVGAFAKSAVDAALEDQKSQATLARTIKANVKSHKDLAAAMEKSIGGIQKASGISDTKLRKSFGKLVITTKSVTKSQKLMRTALNVSAGTGKDLETVVQALSKAYLGNNGALGRLGTGLSKAELKAMSFTKVQEKLDSTFKGASATAANTMQGKLERLKTSYGEMVEQVGYALLPILDKFVKWIISDGVPKLQAFVDGFSGKDGANQKLKDGADAAYKFGKKVKGFIDYCVNHTDQVKAFATAVAAIWAVGKVAGLISSIYKVIAAYRVLASTASAAAAAESAALGGSLLGGARAVAGRALAAVGGTATGIIGGGLLIGHKIYSDADKAIMGNTKKQALFNLQSRMQAMGLVNQTSAVKSERSRLQKAYNAININVSGALDPKATALQIQKILQQYSLTGFPIQTVGKTTP